MTTNPSINNRALAAITHMRTIDIHTFSGAIEVVPPGATLDGSLTSSEVIALRVEGSFKGRIVLPAGSAIHIALGANVQCDLIEADVIYVQGQVRGKLHAHKIIELAPSAIVMGEVRYDELFDVHAGSRICGSITGPDELAQWPAR